MSDCLTFTKVARNAIRQCNSFDISLYTNKYPKCRTIKAYGGDDSGKLTAAVDAALREAGSTDHTIKVIHSQPYRWRSYPTSSFIVRIPN